MDHVRATSLLLLAGACGLAGAVHAQASVVIYRCTATDGTVTVQNDRPCPRGARQDRRVMQAPEPAPARPAARATTPPGTIPAPPPPPALAGATPMPVTLGTTGGAPSATPGGAPGTAGAPPAGAPLPAAVATPTTATAPPASSADNPPPPALFACRTFDQRSYFSEVANPPPRCAPVDTTGIGGVGPAAGSACQMVSDTCTPVPAEVLCESWRQHLVELDRALTFGRLDERETARVELDRANGAVRDSLCSR